MADGVTLAVKDLFDTAGLETTYGSAIFAGHVPTHAITMGIATILESRRIVLLVSGAGKEEAVERLRSGEVTEDFPASALHEHGDVLVLNVETGFSPSVGRAG